MKYTKIVSSTLLLSTFLFFGCGGSLEGTETETEIVDDDSSETDTSTPTISSDLVINEIVADASDGGNDWIELYAVEGSIYLGDYTIVDDNSEHTAQTLPDVTLAEGEFIVIQAIDEEDTPPEDGYYVTFKLGDDDAVYLFKDGDQVGELDWNEGDATEGTSYGLFVDGVANAQTLTPTPGTTNEEVTASEEVVLDTILNEAPELRINEVVAKASDDGDDWIELYVTGDTAINLSDYSISDDNNELVSLPDVSLASGEFYRVYATTEDLSTGDSTGIETVSFKLGSSDTVSLYKEDDLIDQLSWNKGQALIGFSYGRYPDGSDATQTLDPTALTYNETVLHGPLVINEVVADDIDGGNDWFELYNNSNSDISLSDYQVLDESDDIDPVTLPDVVLSPNEYIVIYATDEDPNDYFVPFKLGKEDELNLILNDDTVDYIDWDDSDVPAGYSYGLTESDSTENSWDKDTLTPTKGSGNELATAFNSATVNDLSITISTANWADILANPTDEEYHEASISFNGVTLDSVAIRTKGGSSLRAVSQSTSDRYSFKVDINEYVSGQKFFGLKKFTLQNSYNDPTYMREVLAYELLDEMGVATPKNAYVNVYINDELFGFYLMVEAVDGEFLENNFANANGDLYKPDGTGSDLQWINDDIDSYSDINLQTNEDTTDNGAFINFVEALDDGSTDVIDVDSLLRYMSVSTSLSNLDSYHGTLAHNYYLYEQDGVFSLLPWDFNEAFGTFSMNCNSSDVRELYIDEPTSGSLSDRPLLANAFADEVNLATYHAYLWELINGSLSTNTFNARVEEIADLIREHVANDPSAFYGEAAFEQNLNSSYGQFYGLTDFMEYRVSNMTKQLEGDLPSSGNGSGFCSSGR